MHLKGLYREKTEAALSARTVGYLHATIHNALKQAVDDAILTRKVVDTVKPPQVRREEIEPLKPDQVKTLFESVREDKCEALYVVAVTGGPRQGELLGLKWEDIDLNRCLLQVRRTLSGTKGGDPIFSSPKTVKGSRSVRLTAKAAEVLKRHRERQIQERETLLGL